MQKRIRLKGFDYKGCYRYFVTITADRRQRHFDATLKGRTTVEMVVSILKEVAVAHGFKVWVYTCMPDHMHFLVEGTNEDSDFKKFMAVYKQKTGYVFMQTHHRKLWQENYYEHVLRNDEGTIEVVKYILNNPVRADLVKSAYEYPYSGSFELDIKQIFS